MKTMRPLDRRPYVLQRKTSDDGKYIKLELKPIMRKRTFVKICPNMVIDNIWNLEFCYKYH